jgi:YVTN family beta-propeller protein
MPAKVRISSFCCSLMIWCAVSPGAARASVAYIVNCCNNPSTVSVINTVNGRQAAQWTVGTDAAAAVFSPDGATAYISNTASESISVVQVSTGDILATIPVGYQVSQLAISPSADRLFAVSYDYAYESHIVAVDLVTNTVLQAVGFAAYLGPMVVSPNGRTIYINSSFGAQPGLWVLNALSLEVTATISMGAANGIAISPDGSLVYVPNLGPSGPYSPNVAIVNTSTNTVTATIPLNPNLNPGPAQISPDGSMLWVSEFPLYNTVSPEVVVIATGTNQVTAKFALLGEQTPGDIVFAPAGNEAWVVAGGAAVDVIKVAALEAVEQIDTVGSVGHPAISPEGQILLLPNSGSSQVAAIAESSFARLAAIPVGSMEFSTTQLYAEYGGAAASPDGSRMYVTNYSSGNLSVIQTASKKVIANVEVGANPVAVAVSPNGATAYVANSFSNSVTVINTTTFAVAQISMPQYTYPSAIAVSPDGVHVYVAGNNPIPDFGNAACYVFVIDTSINQVVAEIPVPYPMALAVSPDGSSVYVAGGQTNLYTISTATNTITNTLFIADNGPEQPVTGGIAVTRDGSHVFLDDGADNRVFEVDVTQNKVVATILAGSTPGTLAVTPDGTEVWAGDYRATFASVINISSATVIKQVTLGSQSYGIAFAPQ